MKKIKPCTSKTKRHQWQYEGQVIVKTVRLSYVQLKFGGRYQCAVCGLKKLGMARL